MQSALLTSEDTDLLKTLSGYVAVAIDNSMLYASEMEKAEELSRLKEFSESIIESVNVGILAVDFDGRITTWNSALEEIFGISRERALRRSIHDTLDRDLSLHNDVLFSLFTVCQLVIDVAGELSARRGDRFEDYTEAVCNLRRDPRFPDDVVRALEPLPGFRNVIVHEYVALDMARVVEALDRLDPVERFLSIARDIAAEIGEP